MFKKNRNRRGEHCQILTSSLLCRRDIHTVEALNKKDLDCHVLILNMQASWTVQQNDSKFEFLRSRSIPACQVSPGYFPVVKNQLSRLSTFLYILTHLTYMTTPSTTRKTGKVKFFNSQKG